MFTWPVASDSQEVTFLLIGGGGGASSEREGMVETATEVGREGEGWREGGKGWEGSLDTHTYYLSGEEGS